MDHIGRYQILSELGKGAMGVVYKATDPNIGRTVAIKTLRLDLHGMEADEMLQRFKNEARAAGVMNHPNIITIYDAGEIEGMFYIAMEFIEGQTLAELLKQEKMLPLERIIDVVCQTCAGLDYAHERGIIHRDIKPANLMIAGSLVKIMDFGIAKGGGSGMTSTGQVVGTPNYMSPEQVKGKPLDGRSDLFSLGVVLYEMLTGERPFAGQNVTTIIYKIVNEVPAGPHDLDSTVHPGLTAVVMKALAKAPEQRYATGADFARDLKNYASLESERTVKAAEPIVRSTAPAPPPPPAVAPMAAPIAAAPKPAVQKPAALETTVSAPMRPPARPPAPAKKSAPLIAAIAVMVIAAVGLGAYFRSHRITPPPKPAPETATPESTAPDTVRSAREEKPEMTAARRAPAPVGELGALQISSTPFGAKVTIDGKTDPDWVTPFAAHKLKAGPHSVNFTLQDYVPETRQVTVVAGQKLPLYVQMKQGQGFLDLSSNPAGAAIYVDGRDTGQVTPARISVNAGQHRIALRKPGFRPQITYAEVALGQTFTFAPALQGPGGGQQLASGGDVSQGQGGNPIRRLRRLFGGRAPVEDGVLEIRTLPKGALIALGDSPAPARTPARLAVAPGTYTLTLRLPGFKPITRSVTVEKGKVMGVEEIFEPQ